MTSVQYIETLLDNRWDDTTLGQKRDDIPDIGPYESSEDIRYFRESAAGYRKFNLDEYDAIMLQDGGITEINPQSFGWSEESTVARVTVDVRTSHSRERLWGRRRSDNTSPEYGGLTGEVKRVCDEVRKGDAEFDLIRVREMNDLSGEMGGQVWRASITIVLDVRASNIDPNP